VLSPFEAAGSALLSWRIAAAMRSARVSASFAAGALLALSGLMAAAGLALVKFSLDRLSAPTVALAIVVLLGAAAIFTAGLGCLRAAAPGRPGTPIDTAALVLGLAGAGLALAALFMAYDGVSSLWQELQEGESAEFFLEPMLVVVATLAGLVMLGSRPRVAGGLLVAVGTAAALHFLGVLVAAWRAIGEVGEVQPAGFVGVLGGLLVLVTGVQVSRSVRATGSAPADRSP
jgi:hypothetical protein